MHGNVSKYGVVVVAGGNGMRMGTELPKQFLPLSAEGKPIIVHTIERFLSFLPEGSPIVAVVPHAQMNYFREIAIKYGVGERVRVCAGGDTRFGSVRNGLREIECEIVAIHDGVRPLVSRELIARTYDEAEKYGSAIPFVRPVDSFRVDCGDEPTRPFDRDLLLAIQTPQAFTYGAIRAAYEKPNGDRCFTDDAGVYEAAGFRLHLCEGERHNIKITTPFDIEIANAAIRIGLNR